MTPHEPAVSRWLRWAGTLTLVLGGAWFLLDGWASTAALPRQVAWSAVTLALVASGVLSARRYHDRTGARLCLGLAAATVPVHFAQLGSAWFDRSVHQLGDDGALIAAGALVAVLVPVLALGANALLRRWALPFTLLLFALGCPLLLTTRAGDTVAAMAFGELALLAAAERLVGRRSAHFATRDAYGARALLALPLLILLGRNALHELTRAWGSAVLATAGTLTLFIAHRAGRAVAPRAAFELVAAVCWSLAACLLAPTWATALLALAGVLLLAGALGAPNTHVSSALGWVGTTTLFLVSCLAWCGENPLVTLAALVLCGGYLTLAYSRRWLAGYFAQVLMGANLLAAFAASVVRLPSSFGWLVPTGVGLGLLVAGSSLQRPSSWPRRVWAKLAHHFSAQI